VIPVPRHAAAFCPGHLSGYFRPVYGPDPSSTGSLGAGIVIREGVTSHVWEETETTVRVEQRTSSGRLLAELRTSPPVKYLLDRMGVCARVETSCRLPIGAGFGLSAAALLSTAAAANACFELSLSPGACSGLAHEAEIVHRTGLGDVAASQEGGWDCRKGAGVGAPITRFSDPDDRPICAVAFGPMHSPRVLGSAEAMARVTAAFPGRCPEDPADFFQLSRGFAEKSGLITPRVRQALSACDQAGVPATMTMLGNGIFAYGEEAFPVLAPLGPTYRLHGDCAGVRLLGEEA
jgi:pantoate kinase